MASLWELSSYFAGEFANNESNQASTETDILGVTTHLVSDHSLMLTLWTLPSFKVPVTRDKVVKVCLIAL